MKFKLLVISPPYARTGEMREATTLLRAGVARYHLRKPGLAPQALAALAREIPAEFRARVSLHGVPSLAAELGLGGAHGPAPENHFHPELTRSLSLHDLDAGNGDWNYALLSPVFNSLSKPGRRAGFTPEALRTFLASRAGAPPVYALGGITPARIAACRALGFSGAAALGLVWGGGDPVANGRALLGAATEIRGEPPARIAEEMAHAG